MRIHLWLCLTCALGAFRCRPHARSMVLPLEWRVTENIYDLPSAGLAALALQSVSINVTEDMRSPASNEVGQNKEERVTRPVTTPDNVDAFVAANLIEVLKANGVKVVSTGASRVLNVKLMRFFVMEQDAYNGGITLAVDLQDASGKSLWNGAAVGKDEHHGHSFDAGNYQEALSNALLSALKNLLDTAAFQSAIRG